MPPWTHAPGGVRRLPCVESPERVRHDAPWFAAVFSPAAVAPFQREVRGVIRSDNQTVAGMNRIVVVDVRHQSRLHRLFTERPVSRNALHQPRLTRLARLSGTQMTGRVPVTNG